MKTISILLLLLGICCYQATLHAQCDTNQFDTRNAEILELCYTNPKKAIQQAEKLRLEALECNLPVYEIRAYIRKGIAYDVNADLEKAIQEYQHALLLSKKINYVKGIASCENNLGLIYWKQNDLKRAIAYFHKAKLAFEKMEDYINTGTSLNNLGLIYDELSLPHKSIELYRQSLTYYARTGNAYNSLDVYSNLGFSFESIEEMDSSIYYSKKAIEGYKKNNNKYGLSISYGNLGITLKSVRRMNESFEALKNAVRYSKEIGNHYSYTSALINLSDAYRNMGNTEEELKYALEAYPLAKELRSNELTYKASLILCRIYLRKNDAKQARIYFEDYVTYQDKYKDEVVNKTIDRTNAIYDIKSARQHTEMIKKQKDSEIARIKTERKLDNYLWFGSIVLIIIVGLMIWLNSRRSALKKELAARQRVFDATNEERKRISYDLHDLVGSQLSYVVNNLELLELEMNQNDRVHKTFQMGQEAMASLRDTVWALHSEEPDVKLLIERMQAIVKKWLEDNGVQVTYEIHKENYLVNAGNALHLLRVFQEIITNIYKHAHASRVSIVIDWTNAGLELVVQDNGAGFETSNDYINHYGIESMKHRALKLGAELQIVSEKGQGTQVCLTWKNRANA